MKKQKILIIFSLILIGTIKSTSAMMILDKGRQRLSSFLITVPVGRMASASFSVNAERFPNMGGDGIKDQLPRSIYVCGRFVGAYLLKKDVRDSSRTASIWSELIQKLYPLKSLQDIRTLEEFKVVQRNVDSYIRCMKQYPKGSWGYKVEKQRIEGCYLTSNFIDVRKQGELIETYQNYILSLIKTHGLELTTQEDVTKLFEQILMQFAFFKDEREKNYFRYCGINTHAWSNVRMWYPDKSLLLGHALCDPKMPRKYRIPESQFSAILAHCIFRINDQANYIMSKAYDSFVLTEEQMIENARYEEQEQEQELSQKNNRQEDTPETLLFAQFPFCSEAFIEQIRQIEYERDRMLGQLRFLSDTYYHSKGC